ncbi:hypothetical protein EIKCOROL_01365 [Eikenella corrodens ATCC 23834]|uniref:Uncharacterized protein n=1 Tax=Eikenella corrodens ATCC 23834 TaxID=546274 RepID=C0DVH6_EIKCO|nr:hypothetical protein EIKCOROL_01365 [Eikenella corrodens ATCC 23834]
MWKKVYSLCDVEFYGRGFRVAYAALGLPENGSGSLNGFR